jgi:hypothetical protein
MNIKALYVQRSILLGILILLFINAMVLTASANSRNSFVPTCRWSSQICESGTFREICLVDGTGNICECGTVSRPC